MNLFSLINKILESDIEDIEDKHEQVLVDADGPSMDSQSRHLLRLILDDDFCKDLQFIQLDMSTQWVNESKLEKVCNKSRIYCTQFASLTQFCLIYANAPLVLNAGFYCIEFQDKSQLVLLHGINILAQTGSGK
ncbi:hypothetical protein STEG23_025688 [Scotinomys teguina]